MAARFEERWEVAALSQARDAQFGLVPRQNSSGGKEWPDDVPNANWLRPRIPSAGQQAFGDELLSRHAFVLLPSAVSARSWNLLFDPLRAKCGYRLIAQEAFALDTRLHPPAA